MTEKGTQPPAKARHGQSIEHCTLSLQGSSHLQPHVSGPPAKADLALSGPPIEYCELSVPSLAPGTRIWASSQAILSTAWSLIYYCTLSLGRPISSPRYLGLPPSHVKHGMVNCLLLHIISGSPHLQPQVSGPFIPLVSQQAARVPAPAVGFCSFRGADLRSSAHNENISHPNPTPPPSPVPPPRFFLSQNF